MIRELGKGTEFNKKTFQLILIRKLTVAVIIVVVVILYAHYFDAANRFVYIYYILGILFYALNFNWYFIGIGKALHASLINIVQTASFLISVLIAYYVMDLEKLEYFSLCYLVSMSIMAICSGLAFYKRFRMLKERTIDHFDEIIMDSKRNFASIVFVQIYVSSNMFLLYWLTDSTQVGYYSAAYRIINVITSVVSVAIVFFLPIYSKYFRWRDENDKNLIDRFLNITMYFSVLVVLGGILNGSEILNLVFGEDYASGNSIFMILTLSSFLAIWNVVLGAMMQAKGFQDKIMKLTGFVAGLNILLSFPFILLSGGKGAALAGFISELFIFIAYSLTISKFLTIKFNRPTISQILLVTLLIAGQIFSKVLEINVLLIIGFYGLVFLWLLKLKSGLLLLREKENVYGRT